MSCHIWRPAFGYESIDLVQIDIKVKRKKSKKAEIDTNFYDKTNPFQTSSLFYRRQINKLSYISKVVFDSFSQPNTLLILLLVLVLPPLFQDTDYSDLET